MATLLGSLEGPLRTETEFAVAPTHSVAREKSQNTSVKKAKKPSGFTRDLEICKGCRAGKKGIKKYGVLFMKELSLK